MINKVWPTVSIIVPSHNAEKTIDRCLRSLINLNYRGEYEIILVNNRSTDKTAALAKKYRIKMVNAFDFKSSYYARNVGLFCSSSQIVAFTDSDCIADKNWIHNIVQYMMQNPKIGGVGGEILHLPRTSMETIFGSELGIKHAVKGKNPYLITANAAYWMKTLREVGFFDPTFTSAGDVDISWRILKKGYGIAFEPKAIIYHLPRDTLRSFFMQYYKYGFLGHAKLRCKHGIKGSQSSELSNLLENLSIILATFAYRLGKGLVNKKDRKSIRVITPVFNAISIFAYRTGAIRGYKAFYSTQNETHDLKKEEEKYEEMLVSPPNLMIRPNS